MSTENLKYLSSEQALEDLASFRQFIHSQYKLNDSNKWISFGGSYPGCLSAWFRLKYPHLVYAAVSSSAPVLAKLNFYQYYEVVSNSLDLYSPKCTKSIDKATKTIQELMKSSKGMLFLQNKFK